jgi:spore coat protein U-like protein
MKSRIGQSVLLCASLILAVATSAVAEQNAEKMTVTAIVVANCRLIVEPIAFGNYDPLSDNNSKSLDATAALTVMCTRSTQGNVVFDSGQNTGDPSQRFLAFGSHRLSYQLFRDADRTQTWGKGAGAVSFVSSGFRAPQLITVYGRIPPGQEVAAGTYTDVLTATVDF